MSQLRTEIIKEHKSKNITKKQRESFIEICDKDALTLNDELEIDEEILNDGDDDLPILNETQWSGVVEEWANLLNDENLEEEINVKRVESESSDDDDEILPEDSKAKWKLENLFVSNLDISFKE